MRRTAPRPIEPEPEEELPEMDYIDGDDANFDESELIDEDFDDIQPQRMQPQMGYAASPQEDLYQGQQYQQQQPMEQSYQQPMAQQQFQQQPPRQQYTAPTPPPQQSQQSYEQQEPEGKRGKKRGKYDRKKKSSIKEGGGDVVTTQKTQKIFMIVFLVLMLATVGFAVKNAFFPPASLTKDDVQQQIAASTGDTGFPKEAGKSIAQQFFGAWIPISDDDAATSILDNYYSGAKFKPQHVSNSASAIAPVATGAVTQKIQKGPYIFSEQITGEATATYTVGALIYRVNDGHPVTVKSTNGDDTIDYKWIYASIGVYWNKTNNTFAIDRTSPTIVATPKMQSSVDIPNAAEPGNGNENDEVTKASKATITNFIKAWGKSDTSALSTLTPKDKTAETMNGLNGTLSVDDDSTAITSEVYDPVAGGDGMYRAKVVVKWSDVIATNDEGAKTKVSYTTNTYILKLEKGSDEKYLIQDITPYIYVPSND